ncbi:hypothetical protein RchiOBHm_Chr5g0057941 [Rosa chinensis]|uniref:Uncharacterized protein n=1 Tax=Rosa chinensis TaxID=74649 RepID=A0A2P6QH23_ROSCH|nr:hypothetical protein RchiOBHm_Chr5g0057941 [Rosa chinensis]
MFCHLSSVMDLCFVLSATLCVCVFFFLLENSFSVYVLVVELSFDGFVWLFDCWLVSDMKSLLTESVNDSFFSFFFW